MHFTKADWVQKKLIKESDWKTNPETDDSLLSKLKSLLSFPAQCLLCVTTFIGLFKHTTQFAESI